MATSSVPLKQSRIDIRMTREQKRQIEEAAEVNGMNVSQWSLDRLLSSARHEIQAARTTVLSGEDFDRFVQLLDAPRPAAVSELMERRPPWED